MLHGRPYLNRLTRSFACVNVDVNTLAGCEMFPTILLLKTLTFDLPAGKGLSHSDGSSVWFEKKD